MTSRQLEAEEERKRNQRKRKFLRNSLRNRKKEMREQTKK